MERTRNGKTTNERKRKRRTSKAQNEGEGACKSSPSLKFMSGEIPKYNRIGTVCCPICTKSITKNRINEHLDNNCDEKTEKEGENKILPDICTIDAKMLKESKDIIVITDDDDVGDGCCNEQGGSMKKETKDNGEEDKLFDKLSTILRKEANKIEPEILQFRTSLNPFGKMSGGNEIFKKSKDDNHELERGLSSGKECNQQNSAPIQMSDSAFERNPNDKVSHLVATPFGVFCENNQQIDLIEESQSTVNTEQSTFETDSEKKSNSKRNELIATPSSTFSENSRQSDSFVETLSTEESSLQENADDTTYEPYYWANFKFIINSVISDSSNLHLFNDEDLEVLEKFKLINEEAQQLYVRLFLRKNSWLKVDKLSYPKISEDLTPISLELVNHGQCILSF